LYEIYSLRKASVSSATVQWPLAFAYRTNILAALMRSADAGHEEQSFPRFPVQCDAHLTKRSESDQTVPMFKAGIADHNRAGCSDCEITDYYKDSESGRRAVLMPEHRAYDSRQKNCDDNPAYRAASAQPDLVVWRTFTYILNTDCCGAM
jgi:hypothetical protein